MIRGVAQAIHLDPAIACLGPTAFELDEHPANPGAITTSRCIRPAAASSRRDAVRVWVT